MSFKDIAYGKSQKETTSSSLDRSISLELERFQRQVALIVRSAGQKGFNEPELAEKINFACSVQESVAQSLKNLPASHSSVRKQKLYKDFASLSNQLEKAIKEITVKDQVAQENLIESCISAEHNGEVIRFKRLENEVAHNEALIEERERDINRIHQSVTQVNEIFKDLASMVQEQQTSIDDIEQQIQVAHDRTKSGLDEVSKAASMQRTCNIQ